MKKSRSSTPRFDAKWPGLDGTAGPDLVGCDAGPLVAIAVGNTLDNRMNRCAAPGVKHNSQRWV